jgi:hypothetical protein
MPEYDVKRLPARVDIMPFLPVERYTRAADQERLARQAIRKQVEKRSGKPSNDGVANSDDALLEINSLIAGMALHSEQNCELLCN